MEPSIRFRLDRHIVAALAVLYRTMPGGVFELTADWVRGYSGLRWPNFNVFLPTTADGLSDDNLADASAFFNDRQVYYSVELVHDRFPEGPDFLDRRGYQALPPQPAMVLAKPFTHHPANAEITIEPVHTVPALTAFCTIMHQVFDFPLEDMVKLAPVSHLKSQVVHHYLAFLNEQPVGVGTMVCAEGAASVWNVATSDDFRQRGVASTLLGRMLADATARHCSLTMLYSTAQAYRLFAKFGFEIYTQRQWFLPPGIDYDEEDGL